MRGTLCVSTAIRPANGIIPALAGNTAAVGRRRRGDWDHPRACGEHIVLLRFVGGYQGSSPRLRGTLQWVDGSSIQCGIIPALAGNTSASYTVQYCARDHPRACGEHYCRTKLVLVSTGSSPRLRGTQRPSLMLMRALWIIPALAGNTASSNRSRIRGWDHPRACGEHNGVNRMKVRALGSSPRLRGTLSLHLTHW